MPEQAHAVGGRAEHVRDGHKQNVVNLLLKGGAGRRHGEEVRRSADDDAEEERALQREAAPVQQGVLLEGGEAGSQASEDGVLHRLRVECVRQGVPDEDVPASEGDDEVPGAVRLARANRDGVRQRVNVRGREADAGRLVGAADRDAEAVGLCPLEDLLGERDEAGAVLGGARRVVGEVDVHERERARRGRDRDGSLKSRTRRGAGAHAGPRRCTPTAAGRRPGPDPDNGPDTSSTQAREVPPTSSVQVSLEPMFYLLHSDQCR